MMEITKTREMEIKYLKARLKIFKRMVKERNIPQIAWYSMFCETITNITFLNLSLWDKYEIITEYLLEDKEEE